MVFVDKISAGSNVVCSEFNLVVCRDSFWGNVSILIWFLHFSCTAVSSLVIGYDTCFCL